jgi:hypothetical protein
MLLEVAVVEALKSNQLYVVRTSQFNEFYQQDRSKGPDVIFEFDDKKTGVIECKNVNDDFVIYEDWFKTHVDDRFFPMYKDVDLHIVVMSRFTPSSRELAREIRNRYRIFSVGFQVVNQETYEKAVPIIAKDLLIVTEWLKRYPSDAKKGI